jgi:acyl-CoA synthetase (AMP-forming)/AMP-acid ligase II/acyl carrier protein
LEIKLINTVPSAMAELVRHQAVPASLRVINLAGEALSRKLVQDIYAVGTDAQVINLYGPSEDTTYTTYEVVRDAADEPVLIGRPIANTQIYLLDEEMQSVPIGVAGELYISGEGLARGYLNRPALTAERFVPNRYSQQPGARLYRTGDLARYRDDGRIEYLGRADTQVKVRGYRIELGEIEVVLGRQAGVKQCAVIVREEGAAGKQLVAYVVANEGASLGVRELRRSLREQLPEYMIPAAFVLLDELPLTANGKLDRRALQEVGELHLSLESRYLAPRTAVEEILASLWSRVLEVEQVGIEDNFFELGGHSLLAMQVISRIREALQVELPLRSLFEAPTVSGMALLVQEGMRREEKVEAPPLRVVSRAGKLPLSFAQQRLWFLDQL